MSASAVSSITQPLAAGDDIDTEADDEEQAAFGAVQSPFMRRVLALQALDLPPEATRALQELVAAMALRAGGGVSSQPFTAGDDFESQADDEAQNATLAARRPLIRGILDLQGLRVMPHAARALHRLAAALLPVVNNAGAALWPVVVLSRRFGRLLRNTTVGLGRELRQLVQDTAADARRERAEEVRRLLCRQARHQARLQARREAVRAAATIANSDSPPSGRQAPNDAHESDHTSVSLVPEEEKGQSNSSATSKQSFSNDFNLNRGTRSPFGTLTPRQKYLSRLSWPRKTFTGLPGSFATGSRYRSRTSQWPRHQNQPFRHLLRANNSNPAPRLQQSRVRSINFEELVDVRLPVPSYDDIMLAYVWYATAIRRFSEQQAVESFMKVAVPLSSGVTHELSRTEQGLLNQMLFSGLFGLFIPLEMPQQVAIQRMSAVGLAQQLAQWFGHTNGPQVEGAGPVYIEDTGMPLNHSGFVFGPTDMQSDGDVTMEDAWQNHTSDQQDNNQQYNDQQYNNQQYSNQQYNNQQYNNQQYNNLQNNTQQNNNQQNGDSSSVADGNKDEGHDDSEGGEDDGPQANDGTVAADRGGERTGDDDGLQAGNDSETPDSDGDVDSDDGVVIITDRIETIRSKLDEADSFERLMAYAIKDGIEPEADEFFKLISKRLSAVKDLEDKLGAEDRRPDCLTKWIDGKACYGESRKDWWKVLLGPGVTPPVPDYSVMGDGDDEGDS